MAQSVDEVDAILKKYLGIPWVNTIATDRTGKAYYADIGSIPNVSNDKLTACRSALGVALDTYQRLPVLDGSRAECEWDSDADAIAPGIFGPSHLPSMTRKDYTSNMNDSYWLTNPRQPLEGFSRVIGDERAQRSLRTRNGLTMVEEMLGAGTKFDVDNIRTMAMSNRVGSFELWKDDLLAMCGQLPTVPSSSGAVPTTGACEALAGWTGRDDLDAKGAVLFRRFATRALGGVASGQPSPFLVPFDAADPVNTPRGLNTALPNVRQALGDAINDLTAAGLPLDAPLRGVQFEMRGDRKMPIHGGPGGLGVFNVISASWSGKDYGDVYHGSSFVQAVELTDGCPKARTILTYSQSSNPNSPYYADQTELYEKKGWVNPPFCAGEMGRLRATTLVGTASGLLRAVKVAPRKGAVRVRFTLREKASVTIVARRGGKVVGRATRSRLAAGGHALTLKVPSGKLRLTVSARSGAKRDVLRVAARRR
jgi:acyl-homoserine-lactone acylase